MHKKIFFTSSVHNIIEALIHQPANHTNVEIQTSQTTSSCSYVTTALPTTCNSLPTTNNPATSFDVLCCCAQASWCDESTQPIRMRNATTIGYLSVIHVWKEQSLRSLIEAPRTYAFRLNFFGSSTKKFRRKEGSTISLFAELTPSLVWEYIRLNFFVSDANKFRGKEVWYHISFSLEVSDLLQHSIPNHYSTSRFVQTPANWIFLQWLHISSIDNYLTAQAWDDACARHCFEESNVWQRNKAKADTSQGQVIGKCRFIQPSRQQFYSTITH